MGNVTTFFSFLSFYRGPVSTSSTVQPRRHTLDWEALAQKLLSPWRQTLAPNPDISPRRGGPSLMQGSHRLGT